MKLLRFEKTAGPGQWKQLYQRNPGLSERAYAEQLSVICDDMSQYAGAMHRTMTPLGYEVVEAYTDVPPLQRAWAREHDVPWTANWRKAIPLAQARYVNPTVVWSYDSRNLDFDVLDQMRRDVPSIEVITGFIGSPSFDIATFQRYDFLLTCTEEYAETFRRHGIETYNVPHVFDREVLDRLDLRAPKTKDIVFSGGIVRGKGMHVEREQVLERMAGVSGLEIYCPTAERSVSRDILETAARCVIYAAQQSLARLGMSEARRRRVPVIGPAVTWKGMPVRQINARLYPFMRPPVYGLEMFRLLRSAKVCLNCVDTPEAANMRLFEATGVGTCLLTSWRPNLGGVFELDREIVAFKSPDECAEKARWLIDHPTELDEIAAAGQKRTLRDYTYEHRASLLDDLIRRRLAKKRTAAAISSR